MNITEQIKVQIKPGDVLCSFHKSSWLADAITNVTNAQFSHAFIYKGNGQIVESNNPGGVVVAPIDHYLDFNTYYLGLFRPVEDKALAKKMIKYCVSKVGIKYGYVQLFWLGLLHLLRLQSKKIFHFDFKGYICSELVALGLLHVNRYPFGNKLAAHITPKDLAQTLKRIV